MATITNQATLSYNGGSTNSNIATAELVETLALTKTAVGAGYDAELGRVTYVVTATNSGSAPLRGSPSPTTSEPTRSEPKRSIP